MEELGRKCAPAQVVMGAAINQSFSEQLAVTMIVARRSGERAVREITPRGITDGLEAQLMDRGTVARPLSRFVPPPPVLPPEKMRQMLDEQTSGASRLRRARPKMRQGQLPLEIVSKGRFDKSEPTIYKGEDLDVPTYIRRGVALN
jgi:cell division protein FtsZ